MIVDGEEGDDSEQESSLTLSAAETENRIPTHHKHTETHAHTSITHTPSKVVV